MKENNKVSVAVLVFVELPVVSDGLSQDEIIEKASEFVNKNIKISIPSVGSIQHMIKNELCSIMTTNDNFTSFVKL